MATLHLMFVHGGDLRGFESGASGDEAAAWIKACRRLAADGELAAVESWRGGARCWRV